MYDGCASIVELDLDEVADYHGRTLLGEARDRYYGEPQSIEFQNNIERKTMKTGHRMGITGRPQSRY